MNNTLHNAIMTAKYLNYASDELVNAINQLSGFININEDTLYEKNFEVIKEKINSQVYSVNNYIIPAIERME